ncbi:MAG TPA: LLM class F420-dependent oxidoreductase [Anaerolineae bacterium]|nr:LLM class F420-dependent oxidoreductase [Anaerolineae bacterium]
MDVAIMVEGQNGLTWERWQGVAQAVERLGFAGLYRSDHYTNANPPDKASLELWVSLTWLASHTERIEFGPMVSPVSFRQPTMTVRMAAAVDDLSNGRLTLGVGAGWQEREHTNYGWELLPVKERLDRFEEGVQIMSHLLQNERPLDFEGEYYQLQEAVLLPRPARAGGPPLLIGGNGAKRTLPLTAKYASAWNGVYITADKFRELNEHLDDLLVAEGRAKGDVQRSLMTGLIFGRTAEGVEAKLRERGTTREEVLARGMVVGSGDDLQEQLMAYEEAGVERIMLQWIDLDDLEGLARLAEVVL